MKRCPKCNADYFDNMIGFCLEDGTRLSATNAGTATEQATPPTAEAGFGVHAPIANRDSEETVVIPAKDIGTVAGTAIDRDAQPDSRFARVIEIVPVVIALAHNWWQWLYLEKTYVSSITDYLLSANFLMWLLLLSAGTASGIYSLKHSKNKSFAIISLVVLAINLILFVVPRR
ncbi:MAG: hypothetical protein HOP17_10460 [Acidobacteria bacterium]|nr:hypothetical protein [Acidobacteriota bacterium]